MNMKINYRQQVRCKFVESFVRICNFGLNEKYLPFISKEIIKDFVVTFLKENLQKQLAFLCRSRI